MELTETIRARHATRAHLPTAVPRSVVENLLDLARCAPSGGNLQPWHVEVLAGDALTRFKQVIEERRAAGGRNNPSHPVYPANLWEPLRSRRRAADALRYAALGLGRDVGSQAILEDMNLRFFDAPVGLFFFSDRRCGPLQWSDLGMFMQTFMLAATAHGLATCPQAFWANWAETVAKHLRLPENMVLLAGMALGFPDEGAAINAHSPDREDVSGFAVMRGFSGDGRGYPEPPADLKHGMTEP